MLLVFLTPKAMHCTASAIFLTMKDMGNKKRLKTKTCFRKDAMHLGNYPFFAWICLENLTKLSQAQNLSHASGKITILAEAFRIPDRIKRKGKRRVVVGRTVTSSAGNTVLNPNHIFILQIRNHLRYRILHPKNDINALNHTTMTTNFIYKQKYLTRGENGGWGVVVSTLSSQ